jgi:hypothetical protein
METKPSLFQVVALGTLTAVLCGLGADAPTQKIEAGGLTFQAPASWKSTPPTSRMRLAQLAVKPAEGDDDPAELLVFAFPGGGGTAEQNIKRWQGFFKDEDGNPPKIASKTVKGKNVDVIRVETSGRYVAPVTPGSPERHNKPNYHLLGAIVQAGGTGYYLRMIGPEKTTVAARPAFDELIASISAEEK